MTLPPDWPEWTRRAKCGGDTRGYEWMPTEDAIVLTIVCAKAAAREMPWRTWRACQQRRYRLKVRGKNVAKTFRTENETCQTTSVG